MSLSDLNVKQFCLERLAKLYYCKLFPMIDKPCMERDVNTCNQNMQTFEFQICIACLEMHTLDVSTAMPVHIRCTNTGDVVADIDA